MELVNIQMDENGDSSELQTSSNDFLDKTKSEPDVQKQENTKKDAQITPTEKVFPPDIESLRVDIEVQRLIEDKEITD